MVGTAVWEGQHQKMLCSEAAWENPHACDGKGDDARKEQNLLPPLFLHSQMFQRILNFRVLVQLSVGDLAQP